MWSYVWYAVAELDILASLRSRDAALRRRHLVKKKIDYTTATSCQRKKIKNFELNTWRRFRFQYHKKTIITIKFFPLLVLYGVVVVVRPRRVILSSLLCTIMTYNFYVSSLTEQFNWWRNEWSRFARSDKFWIHSGRRKTSRGRIEEYTFDWMGHAPGIRNFLYVVDLGEVPNERSIAI